MNGLLLIASIIALVAGSAFAQVSVTPRVSHSYEKLNVSGSIHSNADGTTDHYRLTSYQNSQKFDLEVALKSNDIVEWLLNIGYMPVSVSTDIVNDIYSFDIGSRATVNNAYAQFSVGMQNYRVKDDGDFKSQSWILPTAGIGAGYLIPLSSGISLDVFYRGFISLAASNSEKQTVEFDNLNKVELASDKTRIDSIENHQLGLGVHFSF